MKMKLVLFIHRGTYGIHVGSISVWVTLHTNSVDSVIGISQGVVSTSGMIISHSNGQLHFIGAPMPLLPPVCKPTNYWIFAQILLAWQCGVSAIVSLLWDWARLTYTTSWHVLLSQNHLTTEASLIPRPSPETGQARSVHYTMSLYTIASYLDKTTSNWKVCTSCWDAVFAHKLFNSMFLWVWKVSYS